jgi:hypothetical protein
MLLDHITTVGPLARSLHRSFFTSSEQFKSVQNQLATLIGVLESIREDRASFQVNPDNEPELCDLLRDCHDILKDLQHMKSRYDSFPAQAQLTWDRMEMAQEELARIRIRLVTTVSLLNTVYSRLV